MYTGIVTATGTIGSVDRAQSVAEIWVECPFIEAVAVDQSIAHSGVCLTVVEVEVDRYRVQAVPETMSRTTIGTWDYGTLVNLERCMPATGRFDGHLVQGHVDDTAVVSRVVDGNGHRRVEFEINPAAAHLVAEKGSVALDGIGLTVAEVSERTFSCDLIPRTLELTNAGQWSRGGYVNIEYDIVARYLDRRFRLGHHDDDYLGT